ncbi:MAG: uracil-DNA glycosylase [Isosphaeraceae bacterium]|nr:uracil-DNA glycosylase [Isosphaeraceae bacterium]
MRTIDELIQAVQREAQRASFPIDTPAYERVGKDPTRPILFAGSLEAPVCFFGRDLGKDEVAVGQPLVGAAGRLVRQGLLQAFADEPPPKTDRWLESALQYALLTNTVPYKPPGNKAYPGSVKERFRPFLAELLTAHWQGDHVITLGTEAFDWFTRYTEPGAAEAFWARDDRYEAELPCVLTWDTLQKPITLAPLPHPSPLNKRWYDLFPDLLAARLAAVRRAEG